MIRINVRKTRDDLHAANPGVVGRKLFDQALLNQRMNLRQEISSINERKEETNFSFSPRLQECVIGWMGGGRFYAFKSFTIQTFCVLYHTKTFSKFWKLNIVHNKNICNIPTYVKPNHLNNTELKIE